MNYNEIFELENQLLTYIGEIFLLVWDDDANCIRYANDANSCLEWDECEFVELYNDIPCGDDYIDGVLFFGDGTIEFRFKNSCEAENWTKFSTLTINNIINELKTIALAR